MEIDIYNLQKKYQGFVLNIKEFHSENSEIIGLAGNNGAGKTTFLKLLLDLILPDCGEIFSNKKLITRSEHWKNYTGSFIDDDFLVQFLTPKEFFSLIGDIYKISKNILKSRISLYTDFLNFDLNQKKYIREYSTGNKYKIGIVSTLITKPEVVIFDEPFNYLDPTSQIQLVSILRRYNSDENALIILSSHDLSHLTEICSRIILIENGAFIKDINNSDSKITYEELKGYFQCFP
jgi:ABC-2 type transport system ATP-binding protein